jgi:hydroxyethylthiazole kinase-like uncharacterized protein yjeF
MKIVTAAEMREIDRVTSEKYGVPSLALMENAGSGVAQHVLSLPIADKEPIIVFCGTGNNGGDGLAAARHILAAGKDVTVYLVGEPGEVKGDAAAMLAKLHGAPKPIRREGDIPSSIPKNAVIIDALLGTGFKPPLKALYERCIGVINTSGARVICVDVPSGCDSDAWRDDSAPCVEPDSIVTFTGAKPAHVSRFAKVPTDVVQIGSPPEAVKSSLGLSWISRSDYRDLLAPRATDSHKGDYGHVLVIGGSLGKSGAACMAGSAALRVGAGLVTVATARSAQPIVAASMMELMTEPLNETEDGSISVLAVDRVRDVLAGKTVIALGPGLGRHGETQQFARVIVGRSDVPVVLDADGVTAFAGNIHDLRARHSALIMTPHPGEFARLLGVASEDVQRDRLRLARQFARDYELILVLKGHQTLVALSHGEVWINTSGNPAMAKGGTGDMLTGMIAGFLAQHPRELEKCVIAAVHTHGVAGDLMEEAHGELFPVATDLIHMLPIALDPNFRPHGADPK